MISKSKSQTQKFAAKIVKKILLKSQKKAIIIALGGELGSGKTTFVQGFMKALGIKRQITSPTFLIMKRYQLLGQKLKVESGKFSDVYHWDLYRVSKPKEILDLGFKTIINNPRNIVLIEWPEKIKKLLPEDITRVNFYHGKTAKERLIIIKR